MSGIMNTEDIEKAIYDAPVIYQWSIQTGRGKYAEKGRFWFSLSFFILGVVIFSFGGLAYGVSNPLIAMLFISIVFSLFFRYLILADDYYKYSLTKHGVYYSCELVLPRIAYYILNAIGVIGVVVCIAGVFIIGPALLVGAGAFALFSLLFINYSPEVYKSNIIFTDKAIILNVSNDNLISFHGYPENESSSLTFYIDEEKKIKFIEEVGKLIELKIITVNSIKDTYGFNVRKAFKHN